MAEKLDFGDYCEIEQKRYGVDNEIYKYKVINRTKSNTWVDIPVQSPSEEVIHNEIEEVVSCICCGVNEMDVLRFKLKDLKKSLINK